MNTKKQSVGCRLDEQLVMQLDDLALCQGTNRAGWIEQAILTAMGQQPLLEVRSHSQRIESLEVEFERRLSILEQWRQLVSAGGDTLKP